MTYFVTMLALNEQGCIENCYRIVFENEISSMTKSISEALVWANKNDVSSPIHLSVYCGDDDKLIIDATLQ